MSKQILRTIGDRLLKSTGQGKVCLVTGGASGIGRATAIALARQQGRVVVTDLPSNREQGMALVDEIKKMGAGDALWVDLDVRYEDQWQQVFDKAEKEFGLVDVTVNNAGIANMEVWEETTLDKFHQTTAINTDGVFLGTKHAIIHARKAIQEPQGQKVEVDTLRDTRSIVNLSSIMGLLGGPTTPSYCASKGAVRLMTKSAALYCAQQGLNTRANSVHPAYIMTPILEVLNEEMKSQMVGLHPLGRLGEPHEVADLIVFLASDESSNITGAEFTIDGGYTAQ